MKKERLKLKFHDSDFGNEMGEYTKTLPIFNSVLSAYEVMNLPELTLNEFKELFARLDAVVFRKITNGEPIVVHGLKISEDKALELFEKPIGFENLKSAIQKANEFPNLDWYMDIIILVDNEAVIKPDFIAKKQEAHTTYATTERQIKAHELAVAIADKTKELFGDKGFDLVGFVGKAFNHQNGGLDHGKFSINHKALARFGEPDSDFFCIIN